MFSELAIVFGAIFLAFIGWQFIADLLKNEQFEQSQGRGSGWVSLVSIVIVALIVIGVIYSLFTSPPCDITVDVCYTK